MDLVTDQRALEKRIDLIRQLLLSHRSQELGKKTPHHILLFFDLRPDPLFPIGHFINDIQKMTPIERRLSDQHLQEIENGDDLFPGRILPFRSMA